MFSNSTRCIFPASLHSYSQTSFGEEDIAVGDGDDGDAAEKKKAVLKRSGNPVMSHTVVT